MTAINTFATWRELFDEGDLTGPEALTRTMQDYARLTDKLEPLTATKDTLRKDVEYLVDKVGLPDQPLAGYQLMQVQPVIGYTYDDKQIDKLIAERKETGEVINPDELIALRKVTSRVGYVQFKRAKAVIA